MVGNMRAVFMGTPDFAVPVLRAMKEAGHEICGVVTQPDKQKGRGKAIQITPVKQCALEYGIPVWQPKRAREPEFLAVLRDLKPEVMIVVAFGQILSQEILDIPKYGCINVHASLLPRWRGAAPIQWAVISGDKESGVTTMQMDAGIDTGDILLSEKITLAEDETGGSLHDKLSHLGADLLLRTLEKVENGSIVPIPQKDEESCYAQMLTKQFGNIDFSKRAVELERLIRGLSPWPSAYTFFQGKTLKFWSAFALPENSSIAGGDAFTLSENSVKAAPGTVLKTDKERFYVKTGNGILAVTEVQIEGKKRMGAGAFLRGYNLTAGTVLRNCKEDCQQS